MKWPTKYYTQPSYDAHGSPDWVFGCTYYECERGHRHWFWIMAVLCNALPQSEVKP
jgi:hypothetical protein